MRFSSSFLTVSAQVAASNLLKVSVLSEVVLEPSRLSAWPALRVPVEKVIGEHAYGVIFGGGVIGAFRLRDPTGLLGRETGDGGVQGDEPLCLVVGGAELGEQDGFQGGRRSCGFGCLSKGEGREKESDEDWFEGHDEFPFVAMDSACECVGKG